MIRETCPCGATFTIDGDAVYSSLSAADRWRATHRHTEPAVEEPSDHVVPAPSKGRTTYRVTPFCADEPKQCTCPVCKECANTADEPGVPVCMECVEGCDLSSPVDMLRVEVQQIVQEGLDPDAGWGSEADAVLAVIRRHVEGLIEGPVCDDVDCPGCVGYRDIKTVLRLLGDTDD